MAQKGAIFEFLLNQQRVATGALAGGYAYFYEVGGTTPKTIWLDRDKITTAANPYQLDANGTAQLYGDGLYRIVIKDSAGVTRYDRDNMRFTDAVSSGAELNASDYASLAAAVAAIGSTVATLVISSPQSVTDNLSIPSTLSIRALNTGIITVASGKTLTINSNISAGDYQIFAGSGTVTGLKETRPVWFGAVGNDSTDNGTALNNAIAAVSSGRVKVVSGTYRTKSTINMKTGVDLILDNGAIIKQDAANINLITANNANNWKIQGGKLQGINSGTSLTNSAGIFVSNSDDTKVTGVTLNGFGYNTGAAELQSGCGIVYYENNTNMTISDNYIDGGLGAAGASDIMIYNAGGTAIVTGNRTYSANSQGIHINPVAAVGRIIVTGNISKNHIRHGIIAVYGPQLIDSIISNNICVDNGWTGIYIEGESPNSRGAVVTGNILLYNGGTSVTMSGGLETGSTGDTPRIIANNYIYESGKTSAGAARTYAVPGIKINNQDGSVISNNIIYKATGPGIQWAGNVSLVDAQNNKITDAASGIEVSGSAAATVTKLLLKNNTIVFTATDGIGLNLAYFGDTNTRGVDISGNHITGRKAGTDKSAIYFNNILKGMLCNNTLDNWDIGINQDTYSGVMGSSLIVRDNHINNSTLGVTHLTNSSSITFVLNTDFTGTSTKFNETSWIYEASKLLPKKEFYGTAAPTTLTWAVGDRVIRATPAVGQPKAWVCTVAGTPGTWVSEGNL